MDTIIPADLVFALTEDIRIATECDARRNTLLYNPLLQ